MRTTDISGIFSPRMGMSRRICPEDACRCNTSVELVA